MLHGPHSETPTQMKAMLAWLTRTQMRAMLVKDGINTTINCTQYLKPTPTYYFRVSKRVRFTKLCIVVAFLNIQLSHLLHKCLW